MLIKLRYPSGIIIATCAECGVSLVNGLTCWEQLGAILAWEDHEPELLAEHFLTVASYYLQHPAQFTDKALADLRAALIDYLDNGVAVEELRRPLPASSMARSACSNAKPSAAQCCAAGR